MATAVLDIGKTNVKLVVIADDGRTEWTARQPNRWLPGPPYSHADTDALWTFALEALAQAARRADVQAIVTTTHGATAALVDDHGLVLPVLDYEDPGPDEAGPDYEALRPPFADILSPSLPGGLNLGRQLHWLARRFPDAVARARHVLTYPQYWSWRLSGVAATEATSLGTHTDLWEPRNGRFSQLVSSQRWQRLFPPLRAAYDTLGPITDEVARTTGLPPRCRVVCGIHDSNASLVPHLVSRAAPFAVVSTGTWVIAMAVGATAPLDPRRDTLANVNVRGEAVSTARFMGGREHDALVPAGLPAASAGEVATVVARGAMALPGFAGACGPFPGETGRIVGPVLGDAARPALAALYLALMTDQCLDLIGAAGDIVVEGAFAANGAYLAVLAALRPRSRVLASVDATGTSQGAALLARWDEAAPVPAAEAVAPLQLPGLSAYRDAWRSAIGAGAS